MRAQLPFKANPSGGRMRVVEVGRLAVKAFAAVLFFVCALGQADVRLPRGQAFFYRIHGLNLFKRSD
jgi:hypothetical protein